MTFLPVILIIPYFLVLLYIYFSLRGKEGFKQVPEKNIFVSVIVACRNEEKNLTSLLESLDLQDYPPELYEVIIVDDHSHDRTAEIASSYSGKINVKYLANNGVGKKEALKTGIYSSLGEFILTTDADCTPGRKWISSIVALYESEGPDLIAGPVSLTSVNGFFGKFQELEFLSLQAITAGTILCGSGTMCNGASLAFTKTAWLKCEKDLRFDIATGDDVFLLHSLKKQKAKIMWIESTDALVETKAAPDLKFFLLQRRRWASKSTAYRDPFSVFLGIVTFVTNLVMAASLVASVFSLQWLIVFGIIFLLKSVPDFLLLLHTTARYKKRNLMWWFLPSQIVYPFYVLIVSLFALFYPPTPLKGG